jgi:hypothetical protein
MTHRGYTTKTLQNGTRFFSHLKMGFMDELKSGKCTIYAQWAGWISSILLIIFGITSFLSLPIFAIIALAQGVFLFLLEFTFCAKCIRGTDRIIAISKDLRIKLGVYVVFATVMWLSLLQKADSILLTAVLQTIAAILYGIFC